MPEDWVPPPDDPSRSTPGNSTPGGGSNDHRTGSDRDRHLPHDPARDTSHSGDPTRDSRRNTSKSISLKASFEEARDTPPVLVADYNKFDPRMTIGIRGHETEPPKPPGIA